MQGRKGFGWQAWCLLSPGGRPQASVKTACHTIDSKRTRRLGLGLDLHGGDLAQGLLGQQHALPVRKAGALAVARLVGIDAP